MLEIELLLKNMMNYVEMVLYILWSMIIWYKILLYGGKLWRVQTLSEWQGKHHWWNELWWIDDKNLIKRKSKQFEYTSARNWSIRVHVFAHAGWVMSDLVSDSCCRFSIESMIRGYHEYK